MSGEDPSASADVETYARVIVRLATEDRAAVLASHGLTEDGFEALDERVQAALSAALDEVSGKDDPTVPPLVARYDAALREANRGVSPPLSLERFAEATVALRGASDPVKALAARGMTFADFQKSSAVWASRLSVDDALARRFAELLR